MKDKHPRLGAQLIPSTKCENPFKSRDVIIKMIPGRDGRSHRERVRNLRLNGLKPSAAIFRARRKGAFSKVQWDCL